MNWRGSAAEVAESRRAPAWDAATNHGRYAESHIARRAAFIGLGRRRLCQRGAPIDAFELLASEARIIAEGSGDRAALSRNICSRRSVVRPHSQLYFGAMPDGDDLPAPVTIR
ncbi:hypothetical protein MTY81_63300 (plasmid) [Mycolicibacterium sp. TY81]|nr:hypothetical protein MTY81_63300 [Mycolicibacterium sp. TY81]